MHLLSGVLCLWLLLFTFLIAVTEESWWPQCELLFYAKVQVWACMLVYTAGDRLKQQVHLQVFTVKMWSFQRHNCGITKSHVVCRGRQSYRQMSAPHPISQGNIFQTHPTGEKYYSMLLPWRKALKCAVQASTSTIAMLQLNLWLWSRVWVCIQLYWSC